MAKKGDAEGKSVPGEAVTHFTQPISVLKRKMREVRLIKELCPKKATLSLLFYFYLLPTYFYICNY